MSDNVVSLVKKRKMKALDKNIKELSEVTTVLRSAIKDLSKYTHYSNVKHRVNDLFVFYTEVKNARDKSTETLERLKNEELER